MRFVSQNSSAALIAVWLCSGWAGLNVHHEAALFAQTAATQPCAGTCNVTCTDDDGSSPGASGSQVKQPEVLPRDAAELEIALGRIRLVPDRFHIMRKHEQFDWPGGKAPQACSRSLHVTTQDKRLTVKLSYADPQEKWSLNVDALVGAEWTRELLTTQPPTVIQYTQRPRQPILVCITGVNKQPIKLTGLTLWHMTEQNSPEFTQYVLPSLVRLNSSWDLPRALAAAKRMRGFIERGSAAKHELAQSIAELDSADRRVRELAKQKLRETGLAAQIPLEQLRGGPLSPQQRSTVDELLAELEPRSADTPTRLAYWLSGDPNWR